MKLARWGGKLLALGPLALVVGLDFALRGRLLTAFTPEAGHAYAKFTALAGLGWGALVVAGAGREGPVRWVARGMLAVLALFSLGTQVQTWARYHAYLNWRTALMGNSLWPCLSQQLFGDRLAALALLLVPVVVVLGVVVAMARVSPTGRIASWVALPVGVVAIALAGKYGKPDEGWDSGTSPDVLWLAAQEALRESKKTQDDVMVTLAHLPDARRAESVPDVRAAPARPRNVLVLLDESVRSDHVCSAPGSPADCASSPFTNALLPGRHGLRQMRALDSTTALSMAAILTGLGPSEDREALLTSPLLFEYAHAAGIDTAFWTSQNLLYANAGRFLDGTPLHFFTCGTALEPYADYLDGADDRALLDRVAADLPHLGEPYFAVAQLANTHFPYKVDDHDLPFSSTRDWRHMDDFGRTAVRYADAVYRQDKLLARFLSRIDRARTVVVFLSDHGEQIGEHRLTGHTWTEYDVEIHVPMWIDAPDGALAPGETAALDAARDVPLTMLDVAPTLLDLMGLWDTPPVVARRSVMRGVSLLRDLPPADRAVVMTNCSSLFSCSSPNWGAMRGTHKLFASAGARRWHCFDVATDPDEADDMTPSACGDLQALAEGQGRGRPF